MSDYFIKDLVSDINDIIEHSGIPQPYDFSPTGSGRYRKGSGENPNQHHLDFYAMYRDYVAKGLTPEEIVKAMNLKSTGELRALVTISREQVVAYQRSCAVKWHAKGISKTEIGRRLGISEGKVRNLLDDAYKEKKDTTLKIAEDLKKEIKDRSIYLDVGKGVELELGISPEKLRAAVKILEVEGYKTHLVDVPQVSNPSQFTTLKVLAPPGVTKSDINKDRTKIESVKIYYQDDGKTLFNIEYPKLISRDRVLVRYGEEGGKELDGTIFLRRGVADISLEKSQYAQVRIGVEGNMYMKGMAMYSDKIPEGYDIIYNSNKAVGTPDNKVFKAMKDDINNPFGAVIKRQNHYEDSNGEKQLGYMNILKEEGAWEDYSRNLASQMLSKQNKQLIKTQLDLSYADKLAEFEEIQSIPYPAIKKNLMESFAEDCDSSAVHLKAAALPRQSSKVILPVPTLKDDEIYAPTYENGEKVALIRYPHGGTFEIPILTVNNKHKDAKSILGNAKDAVGINANVAERLSGADFDGDSVVVIPTAGNGKNLKVNITSTPRLDDLKDFDPHAQYKGYPGMKKLEGQAKQNEMGKVSNLITDMTLKGADESEIARAVKHSMVVIDAEKHELDWKASYKDNGIDELKRLYQSKDNGRAGGASTLISKASSKYDVPERKNEAYIEDPKTGKSKRVTFDPETGEKLYTLTGNTKNTINVKDPKTGKNKTVSVNEDYNTGEQYYSYRGEKIYLTDAQKSKVKTTNKTIESTKMYEAKDARELSSGTYQEELYADYANKLKALGNTARKETLTIKNSDVNPSAKKLYAEEVASIDAKLRTAILNAPRERQAQIIANEVVKAEMKGNYDLSDDEKKKIRTQAINAARSKVGANGKASRIHLDEQEWKAVKEGAISHSKLTEILKHADMDEIRKQVTPKNATTMTSVQQSKIKRMDKAGYSIDEIAKALNVSPSTISKYL